MEQQVDYCEYNLPPEQLFTLLYLESSAKHGAEKKKKKLSATFDNFYYIGHNNSLLPFLTIEENMMLGIPKKELVSYQNKLEQWGHYFKLKPTIGALRPDGITPETCMLIHLVRAFAMERELVFIDEVALDLSHEFVDTLIPTLINLANDQKMSIIFVTDRMELIEKYPQRSLILDDNQTL
ncbi:hypothetical protein [uncultured Vagococcus sp.]|uniref:hypothetical protein n=1 Tax=uncultured Vagococcus sp. TaxID=189676 RepID=UPI0028D8198D|nr:hypothetical protein [uncultured Vagococcus sp.]